MSFRNQSGFKGSIPISLYYNNVSPSGLFNKEPRGGDIFIVN